MVDRSEYKVGVVLSIEDCGNCKGSQKALKKALVNFGDASNPVTVVTSATNIREGSRYVITKMSLKLSFVP
jgi:tRNA-binding EMAP/Myf-like protein